MSETTKKWVIGIVVAIAFIICITLIIVGQKNVGAPGLGTMLLGVVGLVVLLYVYNRQFK